MARGKNRSLLQNRRVRGPEANEDSATFGAGGLFGRSKKVFPPNKITPSKTTGGKKLPGLFGRTKKDRVDPPDPPKKKGKIGVATVAENWKFRGSDAPFSGTYHQQANGKYYQGAKPRKKSFFGRVRDKEVYQLPIPVRIKDPIKLPDIKKASPYAGGVSRRPARGGGVVVTTTPYKPIDTYGNQYPAEESSVAEAKEDINPQYTSAGLAGHINTEPLPPLAVSYDGTPPSLGQVSVVGDTFMEYILEFDGQFFTSPQYKSRLTKAAGENNPYFRIDRNAVPIISFNTSSPNFSSYADAFAEEDEYAMVDVDYRLSLKTMWVRHIDYMTRKTSVNQGVKTPSQIYGSKPWSVKDTASDVDSILASAGKAPKVRFKGKSSGGAVEAVEATPPPKKKSNKKIICNELYHQGYLPEHIWDADERWGDKRFITDPKLVIGYQMWARKVVEYMRKKPQHTPFIYFLCKPWTEWMAYDLGVLPKNNLKGQLTQFVGRYFSYAIYDLFDGDKFYKRYKKFI
jgi:hypothetical protein